MMAELTGAQLWQRFEQYLIANREMGFQLDVSRVRFEHSQLQELAPAMAQALTAMGSLEGGSIANKDEGRMVGHYWLRAPHLAPTPEIEAEIVAAIANVKEFAADVHAGKIRGAGGPISHVLHVGIGGSALGPQFVAQALGSTNDKLVMRFVDNTDPAGIDAILAELSPVLATTLVTVVSKSGGTPETRNGMLEIQAAFKKQNLPFAAQAIAITQADSKLDQTAIKEGWLARFPMWDWVGGRTSVMSTVGLVPAALQGLDVDAFLTGAAQMDDLTRHPDPLRNPACLLAMMWHIIGGGRGQKDMVILPYKDQLALFSKYLQQLVMESLGKELDRKGRHVNQGIAVYGNKGSTDQHAYVQQLRDGLNNFFGTFIQVLEDRTGSSIEVDPGVTSGDYLQGFLLGTRAALYESGRDTITITVDRVSPLSVGSLIALYERAVGLYAELVDVNAYHQPGVEAGKKAAAAVLDLQHRVVQQLQSAVPQTAAGVAKALDAVPQTETIYKILEHLAANTGRGIRRIPGESPVLDQFTMI
jgi:glucose-6-phosphate isomerase